MGSLSYLTVVEAVPDLNNPEFIYMTQKGESYVLEVDREKADAGTYNFGIDIQYENGLLAKTVDLQVTLTKKDDEDNKEEQRDENDQEADEADKAEDGEGNSDSGG